MKKLDYKEALANFWMGVISGFGTGFCLALGYLQEFFK